MAMASVCCRSPSLPLPDHRRRPSSSANSIQTLRTGDEGSLRRRSVLGLASMAIAFELVDLAGGIALAMEEPLSAVDSKYDEKGVRWSEKRMCPQWRRNSLETVVPENLPRPFSRRRWESTGFPKGGPAVQALVAETETTQSQCFSM